MESYYKKFENTGYSNNREQSNVNSGSPFGGRSTNAFNSRFNVQVSGSQSKRPKHGRRKKKKQRWVPNLDLPSLNPEDCYLTMNKTHLKIFQDLQEQGMSRIEARKKIIELQGALEAPHVRLKMNSRQFSLMKNMLERGVSVYEARKKIIEIQEGDPVKRANIAYEEPEEPDEVRKLSLRSSQREKSSAESSIPDDIYGDLILPSERHPDCKYSLDEIKIMAEKTPAVLGPHGRKLFVLHCYTLGADPKSWNWNNYHYLLPFTEMLLPVDRSRIKSHMPNCKLPPEALKGPLRGLLIHECNLKPSPLEMLLARNEPLPETIKPLLMDEEDPFGDSDGFGMSDDDGDEDSGPISQLFCEDHQDLSSLVQPHYPAEGLEETREQLTARPALAASKEQPSNQPPASSHSDYKGSFSTNSAKGSSSLEQKPPSNLVRGQSNYKGIDTQLSSHLSERNQVSQSYKDLAPTDKSMESLTLPCPARHTDYDSSFTMFTSGGSNQYSQDDSEIERVNLISSQRREFRNLRGQGLSQKPAQMAVKGPELSSRSPDQCHTYQEEYQMNPAAVSSMQEPLFRASDHSNIGRNRPPSKLASAAALAPRQFSYKNYPTRTDNDIEESRLTSPPQEYPLDKSQRLMYPSLLQHSHQGTSKQQLVYGDGRYGVLCYSDFSEQRLYTFDRRCHPWPNASPETITSQSVDRRAKFVLPSCNNDSSDTILKFIFNQNKGLNVSKWELIQRWDSDNSSTSLEVAVDEESAEILEKCPKINFKMGSGQVFIEKTKRCKAEPNIRSRQSVDDSGSQSGYFWSRKNCSYDNSARFSNEEHNEEEPMSDFIPHRARSSGGFSASGSRNDGRQYSNLGNSSDSFASVPDHHFESRQEREFMKSSRNHHPDNPRYDGSIRHSNPGTYSDRPSSNFRTDTSSRVWGASRSQSDRHDRSQSSFGSYFTRR